MLIPYREILAAADRIADLTPPTPLVRSAYYSRRLGANVFLKLELQNPTHSFKTRGASNALMQLDEAQRSRGVVTASGGNHGLGVAYVAQALGIPARIYLPHTTPSSKVEVFDAYNAHTILVGENWDDSNRSALLAAQELGLSYIHPFDDPEVLAGQATIGLEIARTLPNVDKVVASVGGGGLIAGVTSALAQISPTTNIVGVETIGADSMTQSIRNGHITSLPVITSIANTLGARTPSRRSYEIARRYVDDVVAVSDAQAVASLLEFLNQEKMLVEPAMSCILAALTSGVIPVTPDETIVVVVCGGNITLSDLENWRQQFGL